LEPSPDEHARSKIQRGIFASFIYKGRQRYSQEEKSLVALATEAQRLRENVERIVEPFFDKSRHSGAPPGSPLAESSFVLVTVDRRLLGLGAIATLANR
jgi:hypothetical protein